MKKKSVYFGGILVLLFFCFGRILFFFYKNNISSEDAFMEDLSVYTGTLAIVKPVLLSGSEQIQVLAQVNGKLARILASPGDRVKGGQPIVQLQDSVANYELQAEYAKKRLDQAIETKQQFLSGAALQLEIAKKNAKLAEEKFLALQTEWENKQESENGAGNEDKEERGMLDAEVAFRKAMLSYDSFLSNHNHRIVALDNEIAQAKITYESMLNQYAQLTMRAPVSGVLGEILVKQGNDITKDDLVFKVHRPLETLEVLISTNEYIALNQTGIVKIQKKDKILTGEIQFLLPYEEKEDVFIVRIKPSEQLDPIGEVVKIYLPLSPQKRVLVPNNLVLKNEKNQTFLHLFSGEKVVSRFVEIKANFGDNILVELLSGSGDYDMNRNVNKK